MNDDLSLSLFLDGRLPSAELARLEARLAAEPALRARLDAMRRLQELSAALAPLSAAFSADDVRGRVFLKPRSAWRRAGLAAAAVLALAATHAGVFMLGARKGADAELAARASVEEAEALLERAASLDILAPPAEIAGRIATLREQIPPQLVALSRARDPRAAQYADALRQLEHLALERQRDPGFLGMQIVYIASSSLEGEAQIRLVPVTATNYVRVVPSGEGRYRVILIDNVNETPRTVVDEGTPEELAARGVRLRLREGR